MGERVAAVDGAEDGAAAPQDAGDVRAVSTRDRLGSMSPSKLSSRPTTSMPLLTPALTTARITAFRPGASPPPVRIPMRFSFCMQSGYSGGPAAGSVLQVPTPDDSDRRAGRASGMSKSIQRDLKRCRDAKARGILGGRVSAEMPRGDAVPSARTGG